MPVFEAFMTKILIPNRPAMTSNCHKFMPFENTAGQDSDYLALQTDTPPSKVCMECGQQAHYRLHKGFSR